LCSQHGQRSIVINLYNAYGLLLRNFDICQVYGVYYTGSGPSKQIAKNVCAEHAVKAVVTKKCQESREKFVQQIADSDQVNRSVGFV
jgi:hypothetical protein